MTELRGGWSAISLLATGKQAREQTFCEDTGRDGCNEEWQGSLADILG